MMLKVLPRAVDMVGVEGAAVAARVPGRREHEMLHDELAVAAEQIRERLFSLRRVERVILFDLDPGEGAALGGELVAQLRIFFLAQKMFLARLQPFLLRYDLV